MKRTPNSLPTHTLLLCLVFAACLAVDLVAVMAAQDRGWPHPEGVVGIGLAIGQTSLLVAWLVWGPWNIAWRAIFVGVGVFGLSWMAAVSVDGPGNAKQWFGVMLVFVVMLGIVMFSGRLMGYQFTLDASEADSADATRRPWQFSIWSLLSAMTAVGVLLALSRFLEFPPRQFVEALLFFLILTVTTCLILFGSFLPHWVIPAAILVTVCPLAGGLLSATGLPHQDYWVELIGMSLVHGANIFVVASVLKVAGIRLRRAARDREPTEAVNAKTPTVALSKPPAEP